MKYKFIKAYIDVAKRFSELSSARRLKVGAIVVKDDRIISIGYNGMPSGWDNNCESVIDGKLKTDSHVIHAEANAIGKLAKNTESGKDAWMFLTHSPCIECAKLIHVAGITKVVYNEAYRSNEGIDFLKKCDIMVKHIDEISNI